MIFWVLYEFKEWTISHIDRNLHNVIHHANTPTLPIPRPCNTVLRRIGVNFEDVTVINGQPMDRFEVNKVGDVCAVLTTFNVRRKVIDHGGDSAVTGRLEVSEDSEQLGLRRVVLHPIFLDYSTTMKQVTSNSGSHSFFSLIQVTCNSGSHSFFSLIQISCDVLTNFIKIW